MNEPIQPPKDTVIEIPITPDIVQIMLASDSSYSVFVTLQRKGGDIVIAPEIAPTSDGEETQKHNAKLN